MITNYAELNAPCRNCDNRHPACHDSCKAYIQAKKQRNVQIAEIRKKRNQDREYYQYKTKRVTETIERAKGARRKMN